MSGDKKEEQSRSKERAVSAENAALTVLFLHKNRTMFKHVLTNRKHCHIITKDNYMR